MTYMHACKYDASFFRTWRLQDGFGGLRRSRRACRSARGRGPCAWPLGTARGPKSEPPSRPKSEPKGMDPKAMVAQRPRQWHRPRTKASGRFHLFSTRNFFKPQSTFQRFAYFHHKYHKCFPHEQSLYPNFPPIFTSQTVFINYLSLSRLVFT